MTKVWGPVQFICRGDPDEVPAQFQTADIDVRDKGKGAALKKEKAYGDYITQRRKVFKDNKQVGGRMSHQVPAELYHGKIRQTGDKDYWSDSSNLNRHKSCKVS